jgi:beta-ribofuranosylaminobenzene 5'-phosphate synthase
MPNWKIGLCIPQTINPLNHKEEVDFFAKVCPIPRRHVVDTIYHSIFGAYASALDNDLTGFCKAVDSIQKTRWKASERMIYGPKLRTLENAIRSAGALGLGLSSMGPGLFYFASDVDAVTESLRRLAKDELWIATKCDNSGRQVID